MRAKETASDSLHSSPDGETNRTEETPGPGWEYWFQQAAITFSFTCPVRPDINHTANKPLPGGLQDSYLEISLSQLLKSVIAICMNQMHRQ